MAKKEKQLTIQKTKPQKKLKTVETKKVEKTENINDGYIVDQNLSREEYRNELLKAVEDGKISTTQKPENLIDQTLSREEYRNELLKNV